MLGDFALTSTVAGFHCGTIDQMRMHGVFAGNYSCNGRSVDMVPPRRSGAVRTTRGPAFAAGARNTVAVGLMWSGVWGWGWLG